MPKRKFEDILTEEKLDSQTVKEPPKPGPIQNSLDSEEEDDEANEDTYNVMNEDEFEGIEEGPMPSETDTGFTAFNMKEELEEGHFDKDGHYLWNKEKEIKDHWLDNIDWVKVKPKADGTGTSNDDEEKGLADSDTDDDDADIVFDPTSLYKQILDYLQPGETVSKALCRLGKGKKRITSAERWKRKKAGLSETDENSEKITKLTEIANELLTRTGNMDIYQESYDEIKKKVEQAGKTSHPSKQEAELDMYADDFDTKEKAILHSDAVPATSSSEITENITDPLENTVTWELKWSQNDNAEVNGPHDTKQMHAWAKEGYFKNGAWVRRTGQTGQFYSAARVDFELYM